MTLAFALPLGLAPLSYAGSDVVRAAALLLGAWIAPGRGIYWASVAVGALRVAALAGMLRRGLIPFARPGRAALRVQLAYALPFAAASLLQVAQRTLPQYVVAARFDAATFALYAVAAFHLPVVDLVYSPTADLLAVSVSGARS